MAPRWPNLLLEAETRGLKPLPAAAVEIEELSEIDAAFLQLDEAASGRRRAVDLAYFLTEERGVALRFHWDGETRGYGIVRFGHGRADRPTPAPTALAIPGRCRFGEWEIASERDPEAAAGDLGSVDEPLLDGDRLARTLTVRSWHDGDRMKPLGRPPPPQGS